MQKVTLKDINTEIEISKLAMGYLTFHYPQKREAEFKMMDEFIERGGTTFDNARKYGEGQSEYWLRKFFEQNGKRHQCIVTSKAGHHNAKTREIRIRPECIEADINTTLTQLNSDYVDILFLHRDDVFYPVEDIILTLNKIVKEGKARMIGASNWTGARIAQANAFAEREGLAGFSVSQVCHSLPISTPPASGDVTHVMLSDAERIWYNESKLPLMAWSPSARGFCNQAVAGDVKPGVAQWYGWCKENYARAERANTLAQELNRPLGEVVLAYVLSDPLNIAPVMSFSKREQFEQSMNALTLKLSKAQMDYLEGK